MLLHGVKSVPVSPAVLAARTHANITTTCLRCVDSGLRYCVLIFCVRAWGKKGSPDLNPQQRVAE